MMTMIENNNTTDKNDSDETCSSTTNLYNSITTTNNTNVIDNITCHGKWINQVEITFQHPPELQEQQQREQQQQQQQQQQQTGVTTILSPKLKQCSNTFNTIQKNDTIRLSLYKSNSNSKNYTTNNNNLLLSSTCILQVTNTCSISSMLSSSRRNDNIFNDNNIIINDDDDNNKQQQQQQQQQLLPIVTIEIHPILYETLYQLYHIVDTDNNINNNNDNTRTNNDNIDKFISKQQQQQQQQQQQCFCCCCYIILIPNDSNNIDYEIVYRYQTEPMMIGTIEVISSSKAEQQRQLLYSQISKNNNLNSSVIKSSSSTSIPELPINSILHLSILYYEMIHDSSNNNYDDNILYNGNDNDNDNNDLNRMLIDNDITRNQIISSFENHIICTNSIMLLLSSLSFQQQLQQPLEHQWKYLVMTIQNIDIAARTVEMLHNKNQNLNQQNYYINDPWRYQYEIITTTTTTTTKNEQIETESNDNNNTDELTAKNSNTVNTTRSSAFSTSTCSGYEQKVQEIIQIIQIKFRTILDSTSTSTATSSFSSSTVTAVATGASPTALLITGCSGVGKTTITNEAVRLVITNTFQNNNNSTTSTTSTSTTIICHKVSTYDLLLQASWSTIDHILDMILPLSIKKQNTPTIIIVDDLNAISSKADTDDTNNTSIEIQLVCNAIRQIIDQINNTNNNTDSIGNWTTKTFLIGITQTSQSLPNELLKFGRFEKEITIVPPTQYQRECIFDSILQQLVLVVPSSFTNNTTGSSTTANINNSNSNNYYTTHSLDESNTCRVKQWSELLATITPGCVASDCYRLCSDAYNRARARYWYNSSSLSTDGTGTVENDNFMYYNNTDCENYFQRLDSSSNNNKYSNNQQQQNKDVQIQWSDFVDAANDCIPSQLIDLDVVKPIVPFTNSHSNNGKTIDEWQSIYNDCWNNFVGYDTIKKRLYRTVVIPWKRSILDEWQTNFYLSRTSTVSSSNTTVIRNEKHKNLLVQPPSGVLFHGVSGCGKTIAALNLGNSLGLPIIKVGTSDVLNKWLGGSEAIIRSLFARARSAAPCILFFDEIDAIACNRSTDDGNDNDNNNGSGGSDVMNRLLSTLLNEMDGISGSGSSSIEQDGISCNNRVLVIACTNRIESLDAALLRAGRLEEHILIDYPTIDDIQQILQYYYRKIPLDNDVNLNTIANDLGMNYSNNNSTTSTSNNKRKKLTCADIVGITRESVFCALRRIQPPDDNNDNNDNNNNNTEDNPDSNKLNLRPVSVCKQDIDKAIASLKL